jgi:hypothetical protein
MDHVLVHHLIVQLKLFVQLKDQSFVMMVPVNNLIVNVTLRLHVLLEKEDVLMDLVYLFYLLVELQLLVHSHYHINVMITLVELTHKIVLLSQLVMD